MIGTPLNLSLPLTSDTMVGVVTKTATALSQIADSIADQAAPSALNINTALPFGGNWASSVGGLVLVDGNNPSAPGSLYYHNGEFFLVDSTGAIQITNTGTLNVASLGTIGGDYGGANTALESYVASANEYRFYENSTTNTWAGLSALSLKLNPNPSGAMTVVAPAGLTGSQQVTLPAPLGYTELLQMTSGGVIQPTTNTLLAKLRQWTVYGAFTAGDVTAGSAFTVNDGTNTVVPEGLTSGGNNEVMLRVQPLWGWLTSFSVELNPLGTQWRVSLFDNDGNEIAFSISGTGSAPVPQSMNTSSPFQIIRALYLRIAPVVGGFPGPPALNVREWTATMTYPA